MSTHKNLLAVLPAIAVGTAFFIASCASAEDRSKSEEKVAYDSVIATHDLNPDATYGNANATPSTQSETQKANEQVEFKNSADSIRMVLNSSSAAMNALDSTHLFIRNADVRCRVDEVANSTYRVESVVNGLGGYVSNTQLSSNQTWQYQTQVTDDSLKQVTKYVVTNTLTIRVPARNLDSLLSALVPLVDYMDYRNITVNDITLDQLAIQLEQARLAKYNAMLQDKVVDGGTAKPDKLMSAADAMLAKQAQQDYAYIESLRLKDQVAYATLSLQLYQPETTSVAMIYNERPAPPYEIGIGERIGNSLYAGWKGFSYLISGVVLLWPLWLVGGIVFYFVRRQMRKAAKAAV